jgi:hypothetical protein
VSVFLLGFNIFSTMCQLGSHCYAEICGVHWHVLCEFHRIDFCRWELRTVKLLCGWSLKSRPPDSNIIMENFSLSIQL